MASGRVPKCTALPRTVDDNLAHYPLRGHRSTEELKMAYLKELKVIEKKRCFAGKLAAAIFASAFICGAAMGETKPVDPCGNIAPPTPADYMESKGERTNLAATGKDVVCGDTIYFDKKRLRLSEENLQFILKYEGEMKDNVPHGKGTLYFLQHERIVGFFENGLPHGQYARFDDGEILLENGMYDQGKKSGIINFYFPNRFVSGIRGQIPYLNDKVIDGPFITNDISYRTGLLKRTFVGEYKGGESTGEWKDAVSIQVVERSPVMLDSELFSTDELSQAQIKILNDIKYGLSVGKITIFDANGYYVDPKAEISASFLNKLMPPDARPYIPKLIELLKTYQKPYSDTRVTTGTEGYVILNDRQVTHAQFDPDKNQFYGHAISTFLNGDSYEGQLNSRGTNFEGEVTYQSGADGSKLTGQFSPSLGKIEGKANYTFFDPTIKKTVTKPVTVTNGEWSYKTKAQEDYEKTRHGISGAWKGIFHDGNIFKKLENGARLFRDSATYPFVWAAVKYDLDKVGVSWNSNDGAGLIIAKNGIGDFNITIGDIKNISALVTSEGEEKTALQLNFKAAIYIDQSDQYSYGIDTNLKSKKDRKNERLKKASITPVVAKRGTYFSTMTNVLPNDVYDQFYNQKLLNAYGWNPEQKDVLAASIFDDVDNQKMVDGMVDQMKDDLIGKGIEHFYGLGPEYFRGANDIQSAILSECISWTIKRAKNGLKPEYKLQLYTLVALAKYSYDSTIWAKLTNPEQKSEMTDRQKLIISESMKTLDEFEKFLKENNEDRNLYRVQQLPFKY